MSSTSSQEQRTLAAMAVPEENAIQLRVLGRFELTVSSRPIQVGLSCQRLLTLLAVQGGRLNRIHAAGLMWPDVTSARANANLRSVLWRLRRRCREVVETSFYDLRLARLVTVDIRNAHAVAHRLLDCSTPMSTAELRQAIRCNLYDDIAPDLDDQEWLADGRDRYRQLRLHSLEALARQLVAAGWFAPAVAAAFGAMHDDPFRESARHLLISAYLAEGNQLEARRQYTEYCALLREELGLEPSNQFMRLLEDHTAAAR